MAELSILKSVIPIILLFYSLSYNYCDGGRVANYYRVELIRRESSLSPLMKPHNLTMAQRQRLSVERSKRRLERLQAMARRGYNFNIPVNAEDGGFVMQMGIGRPSPVLQHFIPDTGSDLIWLQCGPKCNLCYPQEDPLYNPHASSTYKNLSCHSKFCTGSVSNFCNLPDTCEYYYSYGDGANTTGNMASETFSVKRMGSASGWEALPRLAFGCGHRQQGGPTVTIPGLVGLGRGVLSLASQLGKKIDHKFSYCLGPIDDDAAKSSLILGDAHLPGKFQTTPFIGVNDPNYHPSFYYLDLHGISVGGKMIKYPASTFRSGGLVIDSGSTITSMVDPAYKPFLAAVKSSIKAKPANVSEYLCYESSRVSISKLPRIAFHFGGNATFIVPPRNSLLSREDDQGRKLVCLAYTSAGPEGEISIFGYTQQQNYNVVYDLGKNKLSFAPAVCDNM